MALFPCLLQFSYNRNSSPEGTTWQSCKISKNSEIISALKTWLVSLKATSALNGDRSTRRVLVLSWWHSGSCVWLFELQCLEDSLWQLRRTPQGSVLTQSRCAAPLLAGCPLHPFAVPYCTYCFCEKDLWNPALILYVKKKISFNGHGRKRPEKEVCEECLPPCWLGFRGFVAATVWPKHQNLN